MNFIDNSPEADYIDTLLCSIADGSKDSIILNTDNWIHMRKHEDLYNLLHDMYSLMELIWDIDKFDHLTVEFKSKPASLQHISLEDLAKIRLYAITSSDSDSGNYIEYIHAQDIVVINCRDAELNESIRITITDCISRKRFEEYKIHR